MVSQARMLLCAFSCVCVPALAATWTEDSSVGSTKDWRSITSSSDGTKVAAVVLAGNIWTATMAETENVSESNGSMLFMIPIIIGVFAFLGYL